MIFDPGKSPFDLGIPPGEMRCVSPEAIGWARAPQPRYPAKTWVTPNGTIFTFPGDEEELVWAYQAHKPRSPQPKVSSAGREKPTETNPD